MKLLRWAYPCLLTISMLLGSLSPAYAADDNSDVQTMKQELAEQKAQIEELRLLLLDQKRQLDSLKNQPVKAAETVAPSPVPSPLKPDDAGLVASIAQPVVLASAAAPRAAAPPI